MTTASEFQARPRRRRQQVARTRRQQAEPQETADMLQQIEVLVRESDSPLQQSIIAEELGPVMNELRSRLAAAKSKEANDRLYGPFLTTERAMRQLKLKNRQALNGRLRRNTILRVKTADGRNAYPSFQFESDQVLPALRPVLQALLPHVATEWTVLDWLVHPHPYLDDDRPIDRLRAGDTEPVVTAAGEDGSTWSA